MSDRTAGFMRRAQGGQQVLLHLPSALRGSASTRTNAARHLEGRELRRAAVAQWRRTSTSVVGDEIGDRHFAAARVGHADDRGFAHARLLEQHLLDLARVDVEAAGDDQVGAAARGA